MPAQLAVNKSLIADFCRRHHIQRLALFGSGVSDEFGPDSDVDMLVDFEPGHVPGLISLAGLEIQLSQIVGGRKVDLRTPQDLSRHFRQKVVEHAEVLYAA